MTYRDGNPGVLDYSRVDKGAEHPRVLAVVLDITVFVRGSQPVGDKTDGRDRDRVAVIDRSEVEPDRMVGRVEGFDYPTAPVTKMYDTHHFFP